MKELKLIRRIWIIGVLVVLGFPVNSWGAGPSIFKTTERSKSVFADFTSEDTSVCDTGIDTNVSVFAVNDVVQTRPGTGTPSTTVTAVVSQFDSCTSTLTLCASAFTTVADSDLQFNGVKSATLNTKVPVSDCQTGNPLSPDMVISLTWTAFGHPSPSNNHILNQTPFFLFKSETHGIISPAQASGTVSIGTTNFTQEPTFDGEIASQLVGTITITH